MKSPTAEVGSERTLETLRNLVKGTPGVSEEYLDRLAQVLGRSDYRDSFAARMAAAGFHWTITVENILKGFRYAAALSGERFQNDLVTKIVDRGNRATITIMFTGFVPAFALDKIMQAQNAGVTCFTIHSNEPLPVEEVLVQNDPVVIGWQSGPHIVTKDGKKFSVGNGRDPKAVGIFVTGWDLDKEFQLSAPPALVA